MLLLRKLALWKFWPKHDSYLHFKKKFFSFFVISKMVSVLAAQGKVSIASHFIDVEKCRILRLELHCNGFKEYFFTTLY